MTAPDQPYPTWMQALGLGAYELGGTGGGTGASGTYGQGVTQAQVTSLIQGPATALMNLDAVTAISDVVTLVENYLKTQPLQTLQLFQGFVPGKTAADFVDIPTAITTIINALGLGNLSQTSADSARIMHDLTILFDVFHITYDAGSPSDPPGTLGVGGVGAGKPTWYSAWNDVLAYISQVTGIPLTSPAPFIGTAIIRGTTDLEILFDVFHLVYEAGSPSDSPTALGTNGKRTWYSAWNDLILLIEQLIGIAPTSGAPTFGDAITRGINDLLITSDVFHLVYNAGTPTDPPGTLGVGGVGAGKPTWYSAWNDLLELCGLVNSVSAPTDPAPTIGPAITQGNDNTGLFLQYARIVADVFHLTYPAGSPTDTPTTTIGGLPTWYSAWNGLLILEGFVKSTTAPTDQASAAAALGTMQNTVTALSSQVQTMQTTQGGAGNSGSAFAINFNQYPNGAWPSSDWPVSYTGSGSGVLAISGGNAVMGATNTGNVTAISHYLNSTTTDYQTLSATISGLPQGNAKTYACVRMNAAMDTYVYAGVSLSGFSLNWEIGCFVGGTQTVFATGSGAPLNFSFELKAGVGGNPYRFQGISGNTVVFDYTDSGHVSTVGSSNRFFGFKSITDNNGQYVPAPGAALGCFDSEPPSLIGSGFRQYRSSATPVAVAHTASTVLAFPSGFFDTTLGSTADYTLSPTSPSATVAKAGWFEIEFRCDMQFASSGSVESISMGVNRSNGSGIVETKLLPGSAFAYSIVGATGYLSNFSGSGGIYCDAGDIILPFYWIDGPAGGASSLSLLGSADGAHTYWGMRLANWSLN